MPVIRGVENVEHGRQRRRIGQQFGFEHKNSKSPKNKDCRSMLHCVWRAEGVEGKGGSKRTFEGSTTLLIYQLDSGVLGIARGVEVLV